MIPTFIFMVWLLGLLSFAIAGAGVYLARQWYLQCWRWDALNQRSYFDFQPGWNEPSALLAAAIALILITFFGGSLVKLVLKLTTRRSKAGPGNDPRQCSVTPDETRTIQREDGSAIHVEFYGPRAGQPIVLSHGWGMDSTEWNYLKADLSSEFHLIVWDEPGLGRSTAPKDRDYSLENFARCLYAVQELAGNKPPVLLGHSIGGMMTLTFCRLYRDLLGKRVPGLILTHTTYTDPVKTTKGASLLMALRNVLLKPLLWLTIALSPLVRLMSWLSYRNGTAHLSNKHSSFGGTETWEEIDFSAGFGPKASPAVLARGMLGMLAFDETKFLGKIGVPTLVIAADRDSTTLPEASEIIRAGIPAAHLMTLAPAKHLGLIEHRTAYAAAVTAFVRSVTPVASVG